MAGKIKNQENLSSCFLGKSARVRRPENLLINSGLDKSKFDLLVGYRLSTAKC